MKKKAKKVVLILSTLIVLVGISIFLAMSKFGVTNLFSVISGLYQIQFTDTEYAEIQDYPKVIIAKPTSSSNLLIEYMEMRGYSENEEGRLGSTIEFIQADHKEYVDFSVNGFYSLWRWKE